MLVLFELMEHRHHCLYCGSVWFCFEDCPLAGSYICTQCAEKDLSAIPRRLISLPRASWKVLDRLTLAEAERLRRRFHRGRE